MMTICAIVGVPSLFDAPTMKKLLVLALLCAGALARAQAPADPQTPTWERYAQSGAEVRYFDKFRRVIMSGMAFVWDLHELRAEANEGGKSYRSVLYPTEVNCRTLQKRILSSHKMADSMGGGETVAEHTLVGAWTEVLPGSAEDRLVAVACTP